MICRILPGIALLGIALGFAPGAFAQQVKDAPLRVGMAKTFFNDVPEVLIGIATEPFPKLMKQTTGLEGVLTTSDGAFEVARKLNANELQIGVFHGHELAWAQKKYPNLTPLMIVTNKLHDVRVYIIVPAKSSVKSMADLRGKNFDLPLGSKEHTVVYVNKHGCNNNLSKIDAYFGKVTRAKNPNVALDSLCSCDCGALAVDSIALDYYKSINGPRFDRNLRVLQESDPFPQPVLAYIPGKVSGATIEQFRKGLLTAHELPTGREMMDMWKIDRFNDVPATYGKSLADVLKRFPLPEPTKVSAR
ncbi:MAG TPA: PhnD/SsuA/transferrin family substrate-binding protein [Gemmataceae bacterium]|nr:PhnD/SsuA/transferrin family substrate-binding protein [Gemmataceae bacterium]